MLVFSPSLWLTFSFSSHFFGRMEVFNQKKKKEVFKSDEIQCIGSLIGILLMSYIRNICFIWGHKVFPYVFFQKFHSLGYTFKYRIHFELIFIYASRYALEFFFFFSIWPPNYSSTTYWEDYHFWIVLFRSFALRLKLASISVSHTLFEMFDNKSF